MRYDWQILTMVDHGLGERLAAYTRTKGARGGTILVGRGEIPSRILRALALADVERDVLITLVTDDQLETILDAIAHAPFFKKGTKGISIVNQIGGNTMNGETGHELTTTL